ncbi:transposase [Halostreptopolyspora alba]|uniref:Transposase n=1 Tax=Halostreptopolyspora alba TaxID=2487137 RepID=A0A3N0EFV9_9ACTN|nr:hypothetical protein EFW17_02270 [Nocardiopsaceae bacterium YIM 96095]
MAAPKKYSDELRERATRMALDAIAAEGQRMGPIRRIADQLDIHPKALRSWVKRAEADAGPAPGRAGELAHRAPVEVEAVYRAAGYDHNAEPARVGDR